MSYLINRYRAASRPMTGSQIAESPQPGMHQHQRRAVPAGVLRPDLTSRDRDGSMPALWHRRGIVAQSNASPAPQPGG